MKAPNETQLMSLIAAGFIILSLMALAAGSSAEAAEPDTRVGWMPFSEHYAYGEGEFNEVHRGLFIERNIGSNYWAGVMRYENSMYENSTVAYVGHDFPVNESLSWGYQLGIVTGYTSPLQPAATLTGTMYLTDHLMLRAVTVPGVVVAFQLGVEW